MNLVGFNALPDEDAERALLACCAAPAWARALAGGRPYADLAAVTGASDTAIAGLDWPQVELALAAHPRIGERPAGGGQEAVWSRAEQSGVDSADAATRAALAEANRAYEDRFGHVYLVFATGRTDVELLAAARRRLAHDQDTERSVVRRELAAIAKLRLERLLG